MTPGGSRPDLRPIVEKTVDELEGVAPRGLPPAIVRARGVPVGWLDARQLTVLLRGGHGTRYIVPQALDVLEAELWSAAELYRGDLLGALLDVGDARWPHGLEWRPRLAALVRRALAALDELDASERLQLEPLLHAAAERLRGPAADRVS